MRQLIDRIDSLDEAKTLKEEVIKKKKGKD
jgi:hypothetical protein